MTSLSASIRPETICFLIGAPRSGTTWLQRLLQAHPAICGGEESQFFRLFAPAMRDAEIWQAEDRRDVGPLFYIDRDTFDAGLIDMWMRIFGPLYAAHPEAKVHLEKTPEHALCLTEVVRLFPKAPIVLLVRDSRAVVSSLLNAAQGWGHHWAPKSTREAAATWRRYTRVALRWRDKYPDHPFLITRYEDLVEHPEAELERILNFVLPQGVAADTAATLARYGEAQSQRSDPTGFARMRGATGWQSDLSLPQKLMVWKETRRLMKELGYDIRPF